MRGGGAATRGIALRGVALDGEGFCTHFSGHLADRDASFRAVADPIGAVAQTPAAQGLRECVESGGALSLTGVAEAAMPFVAAMIHREFPNGTLVVVTESLKVQEQFQQDYENWGLRKGGK